jgi:tetratricopeptide (TPR) repeat protein
MRATRHRLRLLFALGLCVASASECLAQAPARVQTGAQLDSQATLERARVYYESARYATCVEAFSHLLERPERLEPKERASARIYLGACLIARGNAEAARAQFKQAILDDRQLEPPDPVVFPQAVVDTFIAVRGSLMDALQKQQDEELERSRREAEARRRQEELERARVAELERLASLETVVRQNQRWIAWVPFGVGQFQNGDSVLGWVLLSTETALAATAITATSIELGLHSQAEDGRAALDAGDLTSKVRAARRVGTASWLALIGVAAGGIVEANVAYRGELTIGQRNRPLPDALKRPASATGALQVTPLIGLGWAGVEGTF